MDAFLEWLLFKILDWMMFGIARTSAALGFLGLWVLMHVQLPLYAEVAA